MARSHFLTTFAFTAYKPTEIHPYPRQYRSSRIRTAIAQINNNVEPRFPAASVAHASTCGRRTWKLIKQRRSSDGDSGSYKTKWCEQVNYSS